MRPLRTLLLHAAGSGGTLSYQRGWPRAFARHRGFGVTSVDVSRRSRRALLALGRRRFDCVVVLHSVFANAQALPTPEAVRAASRGRSVVYFVGNEYKLMPEKMAFAEAIGTDLLVSQIANPEVHRLYAERLGCATLELPIVGLDTELVRPGPPLRERAIDVGYRGYDLTTYLGHEERRTAPEAFARAAAELGLRTDISLDPEARLGERDWIAFLQSCVSQVGVAGGTDYFELTDATRERVNALVEAGADFQRLRRDVFDAYAHPVSGRALPGRVVEAAGTKTASLLVEGEYGPYFRPGEHYVPVRRDLSDVGAALEALRDTEALQEMVEAAHEAALERLTYVKLLDKLHGAVVPLLDR